MEILKKTTASLAALAISASAFAGPDLDTRVHELEKKVDMMSTTTVMGTFGPKTALARPEPHGQGWFLSIDVLYWQTKVDGAEYVASDSSFANTPISAVGRLKEVEFDFEFGLKVGLGYNFFHDGWDMGLQYTYFDQNAGNKTGTSSPAILLPTTATLVIAETSYGDIATGAVTPPIFCTSATTDFKLDFDNLNLELGRNYFVSRNLSFRPHFGLKSAWIKIDWDNRYTGGETAFSVQTPFNTTINFRGLGLDTVYANINSDFWGLGPRAGVNSKWYLTNGFSLYGNVDGALLFGYFETKYKSWFSANAQNVVRYKEKFHRLTPTAHFELGLSYDKYIYNDKQHIGISLGYENQFFWDAFRYLRNFGGFFDPSLGLTKNGVGLYGVTLSVRWDF